MTTPTAAPVVPLGVPGPGAPRASLEACAAFVLACLGLSSSPRHFAEWLDGRPDRLSPLQFCEAADRCGMLCTEIAAPLRVAAGLEEPVVVFFAGGSVVAFRGPARDSCVRGIDPEVGDTPQLLAVAALAERPVLAVLVCRPAAALAADAPARHWFWGSLAGNGWLYAQVGLAATVTNVLALATSFFTMVVYDRIVPHNAIESLIALTIGVGIALFFDFVVRTLRGLFIDRAGQVADLNMARRLFDQLLGMRLQARRGPVGAVAGTFREFESLRDFFTSATLTAIVDLPFTVVFIAAMFLIGGPLGYVPLVLIPLVLAVGLGLHPVLSRLSGRLHAEAQHRHAVLVETLVGLEAVKTVGAGPELRKRWIDGVASASEAALRARTLAQFGTNFALVTQQAAQVAIVVAGVFVVAAGAASLGALIACVILGGRALAPLAQVAQLATRFSQARTAYRALDALMRAPVERPTGRRFLARGQLGGGVTFSGVSFRYPGAAEDTLRGVSFDIRPGERVGILGRVGSGKSTLARLLAGLYEPTGGAVLVDGADLRHIDPADLRRNIGVVTQDVWLSTGTVRENIALGSAGASDAEVLAAARIAGVDDFVARHPLGYDLPLGERGEGLSGGQRQTISIARALLGRPPILILDEPTSMMDAQGEAGLVKRLREATRGRTLIVITHRASLLDLVDRVIVLDRGAVTADGQKSILARRPAAAGGAGA